MLKPIEIATGLVLIGGIAALVVRSGGSDEAAENAAPRTIAMPVTQVPHAPAPNGPVPKGSVPMGPVPPPPVSKAPGPSAPAEPRGAMIDLPTPATPHRRAGPDLSRTGPGAEVAFGYDRDLIHLLQGTSRVTVTGGKRHDTMQWRTPWGEVVLGVTEQASHTGSQWWPALPRGTTATDRRVSFAGVFPTTHGRAERRDLRAQVESGSRLCTQIVQRGARHALHATFCNPDNRAFPVTWMRCVLDAVSDTRFDLKARALPHCDGRSILRPGRG